MNWYSYLNQARNAEYGEKITVPKNHVVGLPQNFEESPLSIPDGANAVYREDKATDTLQLREYDDKYTLQKDRFHPEDYPVRHAVTDAKKYTALAAVGIGALLSGGA
ncbi:hypothetical protein [Halorussus ruber]|uniref:hypothetical protein n=1 Tax=Halorussus ruber TaxID=1126238 RepID=UPI001091DA30|nr:hypothetical protein [Halorussus ruber]